MRKTLLIIPVFLFLGGVACANNASVANQPKSNRVNIIIPMNGNAARAQNRNMNMKQNNGMNQNRAGQNNQNKRPTIVIKTK